MVLEALPATPALRPEDLMDLIPEAYRYRGTTPLYAYQDLLRDVVTLRDLGLANTLVDRVPRMDLRPLTEPEMARAKRAGQPELIRNCMTTGPLYRVGNLLFERVLAQGSPDDPHLAALLRALGAWPCRLEDLPLAPQQWEHWQGVAGVFGALMTLHQGGYLRVTPL
jgi:hypothetical protein